MSSNGSIVDESVQVSQSRSEGSFFDRVDMFILKFSCVFIVAFLGWALLDSDNMGDSMKTIFHFVTNQLGSFYLFTGVFFVLFAIWLGFGPYGNVKLGKEDEKPRFSYLSWFTMTFACGYGIGVVFWVAAEPLNFLASPPFGLEPMSKEATEIALSYAFFHWGWTPWAIYLAISAPLAYIMYRKGQPPKFSIMLRPYLGKKVDGPIGKTVDTFLILGTIFGIITSAGLGIKQLLGGLDFVFGIETSTTLTIGIALLWFCIYTFSTVSGLDKGIKVLSNINIPLTMILMLIVFLIGPSRFIMDYFSNSLGEYVYNFPKMSFWTDPVGKGGFPQGWTTFYWAWWIACAPATGLFIATTSRGRTIKEVVIMHMTVAPFATWAWFATIGGTAVFQQTVQGIDLVGAMKSGGGDIVYTVLANLPMGTTLTVMFMALVVLFLSTTLDSFSYVCAQVMTPVDKNPETPHVGLRLFWSTTIGGISLILLLVGKGITGLQLSSIAASLLIIFIMIAICFSMVKMLKEEEGTINRN
ncbi:BCCT family transporter [Desulforhopalus singaporensis]|uniref:Glycine betaine transporter n=1 Tax=Desulforhopalus singaporensis TaxID=91360 RepID=A0A1H0R7R8_9BACT|nr:BCCT family transporter [Desulforhopalus singaporensis]SDP25199.1 glycine betaine transporter [Desulforhopalus singaporensis]